MSDQDFQIRIRTTADTSGIAQTQAQLDDLKARTKPINWPSVLAQRGDLDAFAATHGLAENGEKITEELNKAGGASAFFGANLSRARQEAIVLARELAAGQPTTRTLGSLLGSLGYSIAGGAIAGLVLRNVIEGIAKEQEKVNKELAEQGNKLVELGIKWGDAARAATTPADVRKIAAQAVPEINAINEKVRAAAQEQIGVWQKVQDTIANAFGGGHPNATIQDNLLIGLGQIQQTLEQVAARSIITGQEFEKTFERRKLEPTSQAIGEIANEIEKLQAQLATLNVNAPGGVERWNEINGKIEIYEKQLREITRHDKERQEFAKSSIRDQDDINAKLLTEQSRIDQIKESLKALGVSAATPEEAFSKGDETAGELSDAIKSLANEWKSLADVMRSDTRAAAEEQSKASKQATSDLEKEINEQSKSASQKQKDYQDNVRRAEAAREVFARHGLDSSQVATPRFGEAYDPLSNIKAAQKQEDDARKQQAAEEAQGPARRQAAAVDAQRQQAEATKRKQAQDLLDRQNSAAGAAWEQEMSRRRGALPISPHDQMPGPGYTQGTGAPGPGFSTVLQEIVTWLQKIYQQQA